MKILDPGHKYELQSLDGGKPQLKIFVKREGPNFPGNIGSYPGSNLQENWRADLNRLRYLWEQKPCVETENAILYVRLALWELEKRAARIHGRSEPTSKEAEFGKTCVECGHVKCQGECK